MNYSGCCCFEAMPAVHDFRSAITPRPRPMFWQTHRNKPLLNGLAKQRWTCLRQEAVLPCTPISPLGQACEASSSNGSDNNWEQAVWPFREVAQNCCSRNRQLLQKRVSFSVFSRETFAQPIWYTDQLQAPTSTLGYTQACRS